MKNRFCAAALALALCAQCAYFLSVRDGQICYREQHGVWTGTGVPIGALPQEHDRALVSGGLFFASRAALTRALEDFCS